MPNHQSHIRGSNPNLSKNNKSYTGSAESEEVLLLKNKYASELPTLRELFPTWSEEDILFTLQENQGDLMLTIDRISEGFATQWDEVKTVKPKKETPSALSSTRNQSQPAQDKTRAKNKVPASRGPRNGPASSNRKPHGQDAASIEKSFQELKLNSESTPWDEQPINDSFNNSDNFNQDSWGQSNKSKSSHQTSKGKGQATKQKPEPKPEPPKRAVKSWANIVKPKAAEPPKPKAPTQSQPSVPVDNKQEHESKAPEVPLEPKEEEELPFETTIEPELVSEVEPVETSNLAPKVEFPSTEPASSAPIIPEQQQQQHIPAAIPSSIPLPSSVPINQNTAGVKFGNFQSNANFTAGTAPSFGSLNFSQTQRANLPPGLSLPNQIPPSSRSGQSASTLPVSVPYSRPSQQQPQQSQVHEQSDSSLTAASTSPNVRQNVSQTQQASSQAPLSRGPAPANLNNAYSNTTAPQFSDNKSPFPNYYHPSKFNPHQRPSVGVSPAYTQQFSHPQQASYQQHTSVPYPTAQFEYQQPNESPLLSNSSKKDSPAVESNNLGSASGTPAQPASAGSANSSTQQHPYHHQSNDTLSHSHPQQQQFQHHQQQPHFNHNIYQPHSQYYHDSYMHTQPYNPYQYDPYTQHYNQPHYQPQHHHTGYTHPSAGSYVHPNTRSNKPFWTTKH